MLNSTKIKEKIDVRDFSEIIHKYKRENIECTAHTFFRLSQKQRKIFICEELRKILTTQQPFLVGLQYNNNYAVFYNHKGKTLKIILSILNRKINVVTFYFIKKWQIPKI